VKSETRRSRDDTLSSKDSTSYRSSTIPCVKGSAGFPFMETLSLKTDIVASRLAAGMDKFARVAQIVAGREKVSRRRMVQCRPKGDTRYEILYHRLLANGLVRRSQLNERARYCRVTRFGTIRYKVYSIVQCYICSGK
jgi:hypothetical protein